MVKTKQDYKVTVAGPGHNFERMIDEAMAGQILALIMTGTAAPAGRGGTAGGAGDGRGHVSTQAATPQPPGKSMSLASYIKAKKGDKKQVVRFLAVASWLSGRSSEPITAKAVSKALSDNHQKGLANPADCLNQNVSKGYCEKQKDGSFFITPEGIEALEQSGTE